MALKIVTIIHTSFVSVDDLKALFKELIPDAQVQHVVDDSLLKELLEHGGMTAGIEERIVTYAKLAEKNGADLIFSQCSSVGEGAETAKNQIQIPLLRIDEAMAEKAIELGSRIGVIATVKTTLSPTVNLIKNKANTVRKTVDIVCRVCDGSFELLMQGNREEHDRVVVEAVHRLAEEVDVIMLAQGSMTAILPLLGKTKVPVLSSPRLAVMKAKGILGL